jgi:predicted HTH domain antitoxin
MPHVTIDLPDELVEALSSTGQDLPRAALQALLTEAYREEKISHSQLGRLLGLATPMGVDGFLKDRGVELEYTTEDLERDRETLKRLGV